MSISIFMLSEGEPRSLHVPRCVVNGLSDVLFFDIGICDENLSRGMAGSDESDIMPTVTRIPRTHGFAPITAGFLVMRSGTIALNCTLVERLNSGECRFSNKLPQLSLVAAFSDDREEHAWPAGSAC